jgi:ribosomal protein L21
MNESNKPQPGKIYSLSNLAHSGGNWKGAEIKPSGLPVGQVVSYEDRANPRQLAVVTESHAREYCHGQRCVFLDDGHASQVSASSVRTDGHCGWQLVSRIMTADEMREALLLAEANRISIEEGNRIAAEVEAKARQEERARILAAFPYLERKDDTKKSGHALAAANIRQELKRAFPGVKFSVTSESYSMGCSVRVSWTDGPIQSEVEKTTGKYQEGHFNGMEDIYEDGHAIWPEVYGGAKYVHASRHESKALTQQAADDLGWGPLDISDHGEIKNLDFERAQTVYRRARELTGN